jgi:NAD(P)-dependent dehydrogenase (short-subunit alcohol dehydrogenase family)
MSWVLVTGAGKRLGRAVALGLARASWSVVVHYNSSRAEADSAVAEIKALGANAASFQAELSDQTTLKPLIENAQRAAGGDLVALVNTAAAFEYDNVATLTEERLRKHMDVNALAPAVLARELAASLREGARGSVVNFHDFKLATPYPDHFSYTLSKYAVAGVTELLARALAPHVRVNAIAPGYMLPGPGQVQDAFDRQHADTPLHYGPTPEDIAHAARFLLENPAVTGQTIYVDAGRRFRSFDRDMSFT